MRHLLGLETERTPSLVMRGGCAKIKFTVGSHTATFEESSSEPAGTDRYFSETPNPSGAFDALGGAAVAANLAAAINHPANSLHGHLSAAADGDRVMLNVPLGQVLDVRVTGTLVEFLPRFRTVIEHVELSSIAGLVSEALGETFEVEP